MVSHREEIPGSRHSPFYPYQNFERRVLQSCDSCRDRTLTLLWQRTHTHMCEVAGFNWHVPIQGTK